MNEFIDNKDKKAEDMILPDEIETEQIGISKYIRYIIEKHREFVLPRSTDDVGTLEYICAHSDF